MPESSSIRQSEEQDVTESMAVTLGKVNKESHSHENESSVDGKYSQDKVSMIRASFDGNTLPINDTLDSGSNKLSESYPATSPSLLRNNDLKDSSNSEKNTETNIDNNKPEVATNYAMKPKTQYVSSLHIYHGGTEGNAPDDKQMDADRKMVLELVLKDLQSRMLSS